MNVILAFIVIFAGYIFISITTEGRPEFAEYLRGFERLFYSNSTNVPEAYYMAFGVIILTFAVIGVFETSIWTWVIINNAIKPVKS